MNIITTFEAANTTAGIDTLAFGKLDEVQSFLDKYAIGDYPINLILPPAFTVTLGAGHLVKQVIQLQGWILTRIDSEPNNYRSAAIESTYIQPMRELAILFIKALWNSSIVDDEVQTIQATITPEYTKLNYHLFGVRYQVNVPLIEAVC